MVEVDGLEAVALHNILGVGFLGEEIQEGAVLVGRPLKVGAKEPVDGAHEFDLELGRKQGFEALIDGRVYGEVNEIIHVELKVKMLICGCGGGGWGRRYALEETKIVETWLKTHFHKDSVDHLVLVLW